MRKRMMGRDGRRTMMLVLVLVWIVGVTVTGCARLPYTTRTIHQDARLVVTVEHDAKSSASHSVQLTAADVSRILKGFSIRPQQRLPLRWFAEETPPRPLFREDERELLAPSLAEALQQLKSNERAHFEVIAPGFNPRDERDVVAGWVAIRDPLLYINIEYFHDQLPKRSSDWYDYNHPTPPKSPRDYILYFEPGRFWLSDEKDARGVEFSQFLKSGEAGPVRSPKSPPAGAP